MTMTRTSKSKTSPYDYIVWPNFADNNDLHKIDDMWHAAVDGRGKFLSADNPAALVTSLLSIMESIQSRIGSASSVSVNSIARRYSASAHTTLPPPDT